MAKAIKKENAFDINALSVQERVDGYAKEVRDLQSKWKIGMTIPPPEIKFVDLLEMEKNGELKAE